MKINLPESLVVIGVGVLGLIGSIKLESELSTIGASVILGPSKYTGVISLVLITCGLIALIGSLRKARIAQGSSGFSSSSRAILLMGVLLGYAAVVPYVGYVVGSLGFFPAFFHISGTRPWHKSLLLGFVMAALFYLAFVYLAAIPVPKGGLGL